MAKATAELPLRQRKKAQTRQALAEAAKECFAEHGFEATTMVEVARRAGVSEQTVYNYFPTKESLVFDREQEIAEQIVALADDPRGLMPAMKDFITNILDRMQHLKEFAGGMVALVAAHPRLRAEWLLRMQQLADQLGVALVERTKAPIAAERIRAAAALHLFAMVIDDIGKAYLAGRPRKQTMADARKTLDTALRTLERGIR